MDYFILSTSILAIIFAVLAIDLEKRMLAIMSLEGCMLCIGILLLYKQAFYAGVFHLMIYTGVLTVLFAASANFLDKEERQDE